MVAKAYLYGRFSTSEQSMGDSYRRQREMAEAYAEKKGLALEPDYFDEGTSAFLGKNAKEGALKRFIQAVDDGEIARGSYLLVENQDRLSREKLLTATQRFLGLLGNGIIIVTLSDGHEYTSEMNFPELMMALLPMQLAHEESKKKSLRLAGVWGNKKNMARGDLKPLGKLCPHWLSLSSDGKTFVENEKAEIVRRIFELSSNGYGRSRIATLLNGEGVPSFKAGQGKRSGLWQTSSIGKILNGRGVLGEYQPYSRTTDTDAGVKNQNPEGEPIKGYYPQIVSEELFYKAKASQSLRRSTNQTKVGVNFSNLFQGVAVCGNCGAKMHYVKKGEKPKGGNYLVCSKAKVGGGCGYHGYRYEIAEDIFREALTKLPASNLNQDSSARTRVKMMAATEELELSSRKLDDLSVLLDESPSRTLVSKIKAQELFIDNKRLEIDGFREKLSQAGRIKDKSGFLHQLDLQSHEGRYKANELVKELNISFILSFLEVSKKALRDSVVELLKDFYEGKAVCRKAISDALDVIIIEQYKVVKDGIQLMKFDVTRSGWEVIATSPDALNVSIVQGVYDENKESLIRDLSNAIGLEVDFDIESPDRKEKIANFLLKIKLNE